MKSNNINNEEKYDAFISYRREGGSETARSIKESLEKRGLRIFLDFDELKTGRFDEKLLNVIEETPSFLIILSKGALDRCSNEGDWVKQEILQAIKAQRNIIPIVKKGFDFVEAKNLPTDISEITQYNAINYDDNYYNAFIDELSSRIGNQNTVVSNTDAASRKKRQKAKDIALRGSQMLRQGKYEEANSFFSKAQSLDVDLSIVYFGKGVLQLLRSGDSDEIKELFNRAMVLNPGSSYYIYANSLILNFFGDQRKAIDLLRGAIGKDPTNDEYRKLLEKWLIHNKKEVTSEFSEDKNIEIQKADGVILAKKLIREEDDSILQLSWWITAIPPWRWIRNTPFWGAVLFSTILLGLVVLLNMNTLNYSIILQLVSVSMLCIGGLWAPFAFQSYLMKLYEDLKAVVDIPQNTFKRWFVSESAFLIGHFFINNNRNKPKLSLFSSDFDNLLLFGMSFILFLIFQALCVITDGFIINLANVSRLLFHFFQIFLLAWIPPFVFKALLFIPPFLQLSIRYFVGMPDLLSLKPLGMFYLRLLTLGSLAFFIFVFQHYILRTYLHVPFLSIAFITLISGLFIGMILFSQFLITLNMINKKQKAIVDYSYNIEETYRSFMEDPTDEKFSKLKNHKRDLRFLKKELSIAGLPVYGYYWLIAIVLIQLGILATYFYLVVNNVWFLQ